MNKTTGKVTSSLLAFLLLVPAPAMAATNNVSDYTQSVPGGLHQIADYSGHWAQSDFQTWVDKGLLSGYGNGIYKPNQNITRAEWVSLINRVFKLQTAAELHFTDVAKGNAVYSDIAKAVAAGYVSGYEDGTFRPQQSVSRQEAAVMLFRQFGLETGSTAGNPADAAQLPDWSREAVLSMLGEGYLSGYEDGSFKGARPVTRAEALRMIGKLAGELVVISGDYDGLTSRNLVVNSSGVVLRNSSISGNLYLTEGVGEGDVLLENVKVGGKIIVTGGGANSVTLNNTVAASLVAAKKNGKLRIVAKGASAVPIVQALSGVQLEEEASLTGAGFSKVTVTQALPPQSVIQLSGSFDSLEMSASGEPRVILAKGSVLEVNFGKQGVLRVDAGAEVGNLIVTAADGIDLQGDGKVKYDEKYSAVIKRGTPSATATAAANPGSGGGTGATPAPTTAPTATASPTATVSPTATASASPTATATATPEPEPQETAPAFSNVSVHDPSVARDQDGTYYVFGSHIEAAKSADLLNWSRFTNGYTTPGNAIFGDLSANLAESFKWAGENDADSSGGFSIWAPDVFWNADYINEDGSKGAYMMYYSASSTYIRSAIGFAVSQDIEGPYTYGDTVIYSGFTKEAAKDDKSNVDKIWSNTNIAKLVEEGTLDGPNPAWFNANGSYNNMVYTNAIDPTLFYDKDGQLWMTYGSWSGGIFILPVDPATGKPVYPGEDGTTEDGRIIDRYFGTKLSGGFHRSGEGPYINYDPGTDYYYMYVTYGGLASDGGYNMRVFRAKQPDGPYLDAAGHSGVLATNADHSAIGNKLLGNFQFTNINGDPDFQTYGYASPGHNSVDIDPESGKLFNFFHARFPFQGEAHEVRVHQMFMNEDGWPVLAVHRYTGEALEAVQETELAGPYQFVNHGQDTSGTVKSTVQVNLNADGSISGAVTGTWELKGDYYAHLLIDEAEGVQRLYKGVFVKQWDSTRQQQAMTFTAMSELGIAVWGSALENLSDEQKAEYVAAGINLGDTGAVYRNLVLPESGAHNAVITWSSSDDAVVNANGQVNRPAAGASHAAVTLTAAIQVGDATVTKTYQVTVLALSSAGALEENLVAAYDFEGNLADAAGLLPEAAVTGNRINNTGGSITYAEGKTGQAAYFNGSGGVRLPDNLITDDSYTVSLWLKPEKLEMYTTAFFAGQSPSQWLSLLPYGNTGATTRLWFGEPYQDAASGQQIKAGQWSHLAFTYRSGTVDLYINGVLKYTGTGFKDKLTGGNTLFALGVNYWDNPYTGWMDSVRIYDTALPPEVIDWLVNGTPDPELLVTDILLAKSSKALAVGKTFTPEFSVLPTNAGNRSLVWSSSAPEVAAVDGTSGTVTALSEGEAIINAKAADGSGVSRSYKVTTNGSVAHFAFEGNLQDTLGMSVDGTITGDRLNNATVGNITYGDGIYGQAAIFDGASGIRLEDGLIDSHTYSVSMWLKPDKLQGYVTTFFGAASGNSWISFVPQNNATEQSQTILWSGEAWYDAVTGMRIPAGEWTHVAFTVDNGNVKVYINGVEKFSGSKFPDIFTGKNAVFALGVNYWDAPFTGMIDEVKVYNDVRTAQEVLAEYEAVQPAVE
ncbi:LamG-like jellyroll fold domain-containing protein [Paenibacillus tepidiphilus]|uniref:LamG-like jellyroll fold domain-containing protein n=1 Tax=Paenibacillus tepidiphilus TaxID=2608683 RepID=UPI0013A540FC|nr:LamG-like jellyroll fold domain-containing protein [Paenibacillus tepidiphilus]